MWSWRGCVRGLRRRYTSVSRVASLYLYILVTHRSLTAKVERTRCALDVCPPWR